MENSKKKEKMHYAWIVTIGCGIMLFYSMGLTINCFSVFLTPLTEALGISSSQASSLISVQNFGGMISMIIASTLYKKVGVRMISFAAGLLIALGFFIYSFAYSLYICYIAALSIGLGFGAGSLIPVSLLLTSWFDKKRGFALGIAAACTGFATIVYPPLLATIIEEIDLSSAFLVQASTILILAIISFVLIRSKPSDKGLLPYGYDSINLTVSPEDNRGYTFKEAIKMKEYYIMLAALIIICLTMQPTFYHIAVFYTSVGYSPIFAAFMVSVYGITMIVFKPVYGFIIDRFGLYRSNIYIYSIITFGFICALLIKYMIPAYLFVILLGIGAAPLSTIGFTIFTEAVFGKKDLSYIFTSYKIAFIGVGSIAVSVPGIVKDLTGSYFPIFWFYIICSIISFLLMQKIVKGVVINER